jgi:solute carrier family 45 protein 1/2/4
VTTVVQATIIVALVGISWAVAVWVPFAIIMELLKETKNPNDDEDRIPTDYVRRPSAHLRALSQPTIPRREGGDERQPLLRRRSYDEYEQGNESTVEEKPVAGGTILGVHNLAIVAPQFIVSLMASLIFRIVDSNGVSNPENEGTYYGKNGVAWVLRFGGFCTLIGAMLARRVPPTATEKEMRRRLGEMRELQAEASTTQ